MKPIRRRARSSVAGEAPRSSSPRTSTLPLCTERRALTSVRSVVLPEPDGPVTMTISPAGISVVTSKRICLRSAPRP
jgi:hypothetical protein